jgi:hypothetical protein
VTKSLALPPATRAAFGRMAADLTRIFSARLLALVASGVHSSVAFVTSVDAGDLDALGPLAHTWHADGLDTPLVLTPTEFRRSLDTFPLEYGAIVARHEVIAGTPPFTEIVIDPRHVRRACEVLAKAHLIHLRQGWIDADGRDDALASLLVASAEPLRALLSHVGRLHQHGSDDSDHALAGARLAGLNEGLVAELLRLDREPGRARGLVRRMPEYLDAARELWTFVDQWES